MTPRQVTSLSPQPVSTFPSLVTSITLFQAVTLWVIKRPTLWSYTQHKNVKPKERLGVFSQKESPLSQNPTEDPAFSEESDFSVLLVFRLNDRQQDVLEWTPPGRVLQYASQKDSSVC